MGAWGLGVFENDDAMDVVGDLEDLAPRKWPGALLGWLHQAGAGFVESGQIAEALAAAAVVAGGLVGAAPGETVAELLAGSGFVPTAALREAAVAAVTRAGDPAENEWFDVWDEAGSWPEQEANLTALRGSLLLVVPSGSRGWLRRRS